MSKLPKTLVCAPVLDNAQVAHVVAAQNRIAVEASSL